MHGSRRSSGGEANHAFESVNSLEIRVAKDGHGARALRFVTLCAAAPLHTLVSKFVSKELLFFFSFRILLIRREAWRQAVVLRRGLELEAGDGDAKRPGPLERNGCPAGLAKHPFGRSRSFLIIVNRRWRRISIAKVFPTCRV